MRHILIAAATCVALLLAGVASGQSVDDATRGAARSAAQDGLDAYDAGDYDTAVRQLQTAYATVRVPSVGLWLARALEKTGKLVEAAERYGEVTRLTVQPGQDQTVQSQAQADAAGELQRLKPRIPKLLIQIEGAEADAVEVSVNGMAVPSVLLQNKLSRPTNPGRAVVRGLLNEEEQVGEVTLEEGEQRTVVLQFSHQAAEPVDDSAVAESSAVTEPVPQGGSIPPTRIGGYVALGVGGVGLVVGSAAGLVGLGKKSDLEEAGCENNHCYPTQQGDVDSYNSMRTVSTVGFVVGAIGVATGVTLLVTGPKKRESVRLHVGPGSARLSGSF